MVSPLEQVAIAGQSVWSDQISRSMLDSGELARRIDEDAVTGVTSNPSIFAKAIVGSADYDDQLEEMKGRGASAEEVIAALMTSDIQRACDVLADVHRQTDGREGDHHEDGGEDGHRTGQAAEFGDEPRVAPLVDHAHQEEERRVGKECRSRWSPYH